ncbi:glycosyltransferase family 2 protein [Methylocella silvestris]|nr:glycosyltransferase [Methylocella silvestris]
MLFGKSRSSGEHARSIIEKSGIFDEGWYLETYPDVRAEGVDPLDHYIRFGSDENRNPNLLFDALFYKQQAASGGTNPLVHYITTGERAGLSPSIFFPLPWYLAKYPDIKQAGVSALSHFMLYGAKEHRNPNPLFDTAWFIREFNLSPDLAPSAFHYFMANWRTEKLRPNPLFDPLWYLSRYPDVAQAGVDPFLHYLTSGGREGRSPHPLFEADFYLASYPDVYQAGINPLAHYLDHGRFEVRNVNRYFDATWYLTSYPDVQQANLDPVRHYIEHGAKEGRNPSPLFDSSWYLEAYPDVAATGVNPLHHFLECGNREGREPLDPNLTFAKYNLAKTQRNVVETTEIESHIAVMTWRPRFAIVSLNEIDVFSTPSLKNQPYPCWELVEADSRRLADIEADYLIFVDVAASCDRRMLYVYASYIIAYPDVDILYCDADCVNTQGMNERPFFKPDWSPDYLEVFNYIGAGACYSRSLVHKHWPESQSYYDFVLRAVEGEKKIHHLRDILVHLRSPTEFYTEQSEVEQALAARLQRTGRNGAAARIGGTDYYRINLRRATAPLVSVVIPTAGKTIDIEGQKIDLIVNCIEQISANSAYKNLEFVIVDNGDLTFQQRRRLAAFGVKQRVTYREPVFNVSKKLNLGARYASGDFLLLMNDDIEPLTTDWIETLLNEFDKPWVGVVGAKLLFPAELIQHAGVILHDGNPDHVRKFYPHDDEGYFGSTCANRNYVAVTGACMMTRTALYREVGGYNEHLAVSYNDVDYCFKVREAGYTAVYAAAAELTHFESQSRAPKLDLSEADYFHKRWRHMLARDPFYNGQMLSSAPPNYKIVHRTRSF